METNKSKLIDAAPNKRRPRIDAIKGQAYSKLIDTAAFNWGNTVIKLCMKTVVVTDVIDMTKYFNCYLLVHVDIVL
jgi:hypothetical protein